MSGSQTRRERYILRATQAGDYADIRSLCAAVYPFSAPWAEAQIRSHLEIFPDGQRVIFDRQEERVVAMSASLVIDWDDYAVDGTWRDFTDGGYFRNHDPAHGRTLYGAEIIVHPAHQGKGLGKRLYAERRELARRLRLRRIRAGARLRGYGQHAAAMSAENYLEKVVAGDIPDPTISFQLRQGFSVIALVSGYLPGDPESLGWAVVIEWLNPDVAPRPESEPIRPIQT